MTPADYDAWYRTPRGAWIGETEYRLLNDALAPRRGETVIDVGCGSGYFTRRLALDGAQVTGVDIDPAMLEFARTHAAAGERYVRGDARRLPFPDGSFDLAVSITALCFVEGESVALAEMLRVTRRRFAIGLLNRRSLLYLDKGRRGGSGAYRGARWHTRAEAAALVAALPVRDVELATALFLPGGAALARLAEPLLPHALPFGAFLVVAASPSSAR